MGNCCTFLPFCSEPKTDLEEDLFDLVLEDLVREIRQQKVTKFLQIERKLYSKMA